MSNIATRARVITAPAEEFAPVTPDDVENLPKGVTRALYVGVAGTLSVVDRRGAAVTIASGDAQYHPLQVLRVNATGTTAENIVALY